jgi:hypothetical protein
MRRRSIPGDWRRDRKRTHRQTGSPSQPSAEQRAALAKASELTLWEEPRPAEVRDWKVALRFPLPRQSVSLLRLGW